MASALEERPSPAREPYPLLSRAQVLELTSEDLVDIGCHGMSHMGLRVASRQALEREILGAKTLLEDSLGVGVNTFAYPFGGPGTFPKEAVRRVRSAGFIGAFTGVYGPTGRGADPYRIPRSRLSWAEDARALGRLLKGSYDWYASVQRLQGLVNVRAASRVPSS